MGLKKSMISNLLVLCAACTTSSGLNEVDPENVVRSEVAEGQSCTEERFFYKSVDNRPSKIGYVDVGDLNEALVNFKSVGQKRGQSRCAYNTLLLSVIARKGMGSILRWARKILEVQPKAILARYYIALGYMSEGRLSSAQFVLEQLLSEKVQAHRGMIYNALAIIQYKRGASYEAAFLFRKALSLVKEYQRAPLLNLAFLAARFQDRVTAEKLLAPIAVSAPAGALLVLAMAYKEQNKFIDAERMLEKAIALQPKNKTLLYHQGKLLYIDLKKNDGALTSFQAFLEQNKNLATRRRDEVLSYVEKIQEVKKK